METHSPLKKKLLIIVGPTATGKTDLALELAKKINGELVSCDSRQVYKGLDIGTGKLPGGEVPYQKYDKVWIIDQIPVWMYDLVPPQLQYDVWQYIKDANEVIAQIIKGGKYPIIVGGTGLYLKGLLEGLSEIQIPVDLNLRQELEKLSLQEVQDKLEELDQYSFKTLNNSELHNKRRLIRRIEKKILTRNSNGPTFNEGLSSSYQLFKIGLTAPREILYKRIDERVDSRIKKGMIAESERLHTEGLTFQRMKQLGLEYGLLAELFEGTINEGQFSEKLKFKIHQYAKRQLTWYKADNQIEWFDISKKDFMQQVEEKVLAWYNS